MKLNKSRQERNKLAEDIVERFYRCYWCGNTGTILNHKVCWEELKAFALQPEIYRY